MNSKALTEKRQLIEKKFQSYSENMQQQDNETKQKTLKNWQKKEAHLKSAQESRQEYDKEKVYR